MNCSLSRLAVPLPLAMAVMPYFFHEPFDQLRGGGFSGFGPRQGEMAHAGVQHLAVFVDDG